MILLIEIDDAAVPLVLEAVPDGSATTYAECRDWAEAAGVAADLAKATSVEPEYGDPVG
jgi:hypothetical protein